MEAKQSARGDSSYVPMDERVGAGKLLQIQDQVEQTDIEPYERTQNRYVCLVSIGFSSCDPVIRLILFVTCFLSFRISHISPCLCFFPRLFSIGCAGFAAASLQSILAVRECWLLHCPII
jgi:hypothetical protein